MTPSLQFDEINAAALRLYPGLLYQWFPGGVLHGDEYTVLNPSRTDASKGSFKINTTTGFWADFATNQRGRTPISLYAEFFTDNLDYQESATQIARQIGMLNDCPPDPAIARLMDHLKNHPNPEVDRSFDAGWEQIPASVAAGPPLIPANCPTWTYFTMDGQVLGYVSRRLLADGKKDFLPTTCWRNADGKEVWRHKGFTEPRPIYNRLALAGAEAVLIVEGEKAADAGAFWFPDVITISWPGGAQSVGKVDWSELRGKAVALLPDHDEPGRAAMRTLAAKLMTMGCKSIYVGTIPDDYPEGWDIADNTWADQVEAKAWLDGLTWMKYDVQASDQVNTPKTPREERIEEAVARANGKGPEYEVKPEKAIFEPFPVPALQGIADWIDTQVGISHPLVTQSVTLALASLAASRRYQSPYGGQGGLSFGLVADSVGELHDYLDVIYRILDAAGLRRLVRMTRFASDNQLYQALEKAPVQIYLSADYGSAVALTKKQTSGAMESLLSALTAVSRGKDIQLDRSQVADPKAVIDDNPVLYAPALTTVALLAFDSLTALWRSTEYGRGAVELFSYAFAYAEDQVVNGVPTPDPVPEWLIQNLQMIRGVHPQLDGVSYPLSAIFPNNGLFAFDSISIISTVSAAEYALLIKPLDDLLMTDLDVRPVVLAGRRRVGFIATLLAIFGGTPITADLVAYAVRFELARFEGFKHQKHQAKQDKEQGVYEQVLATIAKHRHNGIRLSCLPAESWGYRRMDEEDRFKLIQKMKDDKVIVQIEPKPTGKAGRQPVAVLVAKAYVRRVKTGEEQA